MKNKKNQRFSTLSIIHEKLSFEKRRKNGTTFSLTETAESIAAFANYN